jgi:hypothetical protein
VESALEPHLLPSMLADRHLDLAFVDLDFGYTTRQETGLTALRHLADYQVPAIIYSADSEENRLLFLLAAFQFYRPVTLLPKNTTAAQIHDLVIRLEQNAMVLVPDPTGDPYRPPPGQAPAIDRLIRRADDLRLWRALSMHSRRTEVASASGFSPRSVDKFLDATGEIVEQIGSILPSNREVFRDLSSGADGAAVKRELLATAHAFAVTHYRFFSDPEIRALIEARDKSHLHPASSQVRTGKRGR